MPLFCRLARTLEEDRVGVNLVAAVARKGDRRAGHQSARNGGKVHRVFSPLSAGVIKKLKFFFEKDFWVEDLLCFLYYYLVVCNSFFFYFENKFHKAAGM